jgi:hypothetical protein
VLPEHASQPTALCVLYFAFENIHAKQHGNALAAARVYQSLTKKTRAEFKEWTEENKTLKMDVPDYSGVLTSWTILSKLIKPCPILIKGMPLVPTVDVWKLKSA